MENVWYIGSIINDNEDSWAIEGIFPTRNSAISNLKEGEFCAKIQFGLRVPKNVEYPDESYWKLKGKIVPSESNKR